MDNNSFYYPSDQSHYPNTYNSASHPPALKTPHSSYLPHNSYNPGYGDAGSAYMNAGANSMNPLPIKDTSNSILYNSLKQTWDCGICRKSFKEKLDLEQHLNSGSLI
jgi:hypothetical protein